VFHDSNINKEVGHERVFNIQGFPTEIQISEVGHGNGMIVKNVVQMLLLLFIVVNALRHA